MAPLSIGELTRQADLVVHGKVLGSASDQDDAGRIFTRVELQVVEVWKGPQQPERIRVVHGGGSVGHRRVVVSGQARYEPGQEVVAFLVFNPRGEPVTLGLAQGKFDVWTDPATKEKLAANPFHGRFGEPNRLGLQQTGSDPQRLPLAQLKLRVQGGAR